MSSLQATNKELLTWNDTILKNEKTKILSTQDIKQLLFNRGGTKNNIKGKKSKSTLIKLLKQDYSAMLETQIEDLTAEQIMVELKLHGLKCRNARRQILIRRLTEGLNEKIAPRRWIHHTYKSTNDSNAPIMINKDEFFIAKTDGLYKYNIFHKKWKKWMKYPSNFKKNNMKPQICLNRKDKIIYIYDGADGKLLKLNYETDKYLIFKNLVKVGDGFKCIYIHKQLHIIGGSDNNKHLIFNEKQKKFNKLYSFREYGNGMENFGLIHITQKNEMLFIGGKTHEILYDVCHHTLYSYNTIQHKWRKEMRLFVPMGLSNFGCCITKNQRYIILLGGYSNYGYSNKIYVIDTEDMTISDCNIPCPSKNEFDAIIMDDGIKEELIVSGFVRRCWNEYEIGLNRFPPQYIIQLMKSWMMEQYIHLLEYTKGDHWKICVSDILNNLK